MLKSKAKLCAGKRQGQARLNQADRDLVTLGIAIAAIILFVGTGGAVVPKAVASLAGYGVGPDKALVNALLLNIALIIFGWRRHRQLSEEIAQRREAEEKARRLAETDPLTGCLNRRSFGRALETMMTAAADKGRSVAIMMIDLDNFKKINDFWGHSAGDKVLVESARQIGAILPEEAAMARIGGDEFACAVTFDTARPEMVDHFAVAIVETIAKLSAEDEISKDVTASVGITRTDTALRPGNKVCDAGYLLDMADLAMYHAKRQGRNSYFWFEDSMADEKRLRKEIETGIRKGIVAGEFVPFYEQQIDVQSGELTGFEMLARWKSPAFGVVKPDIFIPIAEDIGVIGQLSENLIAMALEDAKQWDPKLTLAVNISALQLRDPWFSQKLLKLLVEANFPPNRLEIEITESCIHENISLARSLITSLKNQGIRVSLDDFGTGYSSLTQLRSLPFDRIKIDRSFVTSLAQSESDAAIVDSIAMLGKGLGLPITAEGIETHDILERLRPYGEIKGQGYFYGQPKSAIDTQQWLAEQGLLIAERALAETTRQEEPEGAARLARERLAGNG